METKKQSVHNTKVAKENDYVKLARELNTKIMDLSLHFRIIGGKGGVISSLDMIFAYNSDSDEIHFESGSCPMYKLNCPMPTLDSVKNNINLDDHIYFTAIGIVGGLDKKINVKELCNNKELETAFNNILDGVRKQHNKTFKKTKILNDNSLVL